MNLRKIEIIYYSFWIFLLLLLGFPLSSFDQIVHIKQLHANDSQGYPAAPFLKGTDVTISGIITLGTGILSSTHTEAFLQDTTGGIMLYDPDSSHLLELGDSVTITGSIIQYLGNTGVKPSEIIKHGKQQPPEALILNCADVQNAFKFNNDEPNESRLIRLNHVQRRMTTPYWTLLDSTGLCKMYLHPNSGIIYLDKELSVIGILMQRDDTSPFTDSYVIMPRFAGDILAENPPIFITPASEVEIKSTEVTIEWDTDSKSTSVVKYGLTINYELGKIGDSTAAKTHRVSLPGLKPATFYHCHAISSNEYGTSVSSDLLFCTGSRPESTGEIQVYFNKSVDHSVAKYRYASGNVNLKNKLLHRLRAAKYSIDMCINILTLDEIVSELINAHWRGVSVRVIYDDKNGNEDTQRLADEGVPVINDAFGTNSGDENDLMHNKFVILDHRDTTSAADDWVWTGSYNFSYNGTYKNAENVVEIQDEAIAKCYTAEFNEMWGSTCETPNPAQSRFGRRKFQNTPHVFYINGVEIHQFFSPTDKIAHQLELLLKTAEHSLSFCIYSFTQSGLAQRMRDRRDANPCFNILGVFDEGQKSTDISQWHTLLNWNPPADIWLDKVDGLLHHKYLIIDGIETDSNPIVVTGSYNWSISAENKHDENILIIKDSTIADLYCQEFIARYREAGGTAVDEKPAQVGSVQILKQCFLYQNYPNPFNKTTEIRYSLRKPNSHVHLTIHNVVGQCVRTLIDATLNPGDYRCSWDAQSDEGQLVSSGIYFIQLRASREIHVRKIILLY